jgi:hypothetical protein
MTKRERQKQEVLPSNVSKSVNQNLLQSSPSFSIFFYFCLEFRIREQKVRE